MRHVWNGELGTHTYIATKGGAQYLSPAGGAVFVYIAGPMRGAGTVHSEENIQAGIEAYRRVLLAGHAPFCPHLSHYADPEYQHVTIERWLDFDRAWISRCHALVRLPGISRGADQEVAWAREFGLPVFAGVDAFLLAYGSAAQ